MVIVINNGKIGIFDSGIGGATVLKEILKILPNEDYFYYSDSKNNPYGDKKKDELIKYADNIAATMIEKNCKAIVIACNTATAKALDFLMNKYANIPIIGIEPAYKMVYDYATEKETLIIATKATLESEKFNKLYNKYNNNCTYLKACVGLADLIENGSNLEIEEYIKKNLSEYVGKIKNVVLGCTHYVLIKNELKIFFGEKINFFDGSKGIANNLKNILIEKELGNSSSEHGKIEFYDSNEDKMICQNKEERFYKYLVTSL